jgi:hypothetical protein
MERLILYWLRGDYVITCAFACAMHHINGTARYSELSPYGVRARKG